MTNTPEEYQPRSGDGSIAAEDDSLLRQPEGVGGQDPDVERGDIRKSTEQDEPGAIDEPEYRRGT